jgi:hypothetical protein
MGKEIVFQDEFENGLDVGLIEDGKSWNYMQMGPFLFGKDGFNLEEENGIRAVPTGKNPKTGAPAFTNTAPGQGDHMKWSINVNMTTSDGMHGIEIMPGKTLNVEATIGGTQYGVEDHPFGDAVPNAKDDPRLASSLIVSTCI